MSHMGEGGEAVRSPQPPKVSLKKPVFGCKKPTFSVKSDTLSPKCTKGVGIVLKKIF